MDVLVTVCRLGLSLPVYMEINPPMKCTQILRNTAFALLAVGMGFSSTAAFAQYVPYGSAAQQQPRYQQQSVYQPRVASNVGPEMVGTPTPASYPQPVQAPASYPQPATATYPAAGCNTGYAQVPSNYAACNTDVSYSNQGSYGYGLGLGNGGARRGQWFAGIYGITMDRVNEGYKPLIVTVDPTNPPALYPYYAPASAVVVSTDDIGYDATAGVEIRFGRTIGCNWALEAGFWSVDSSCPGKFESSSATSRLYSVYNYGGVEFDADGVGALPYRNMNEYTDYGNPVQNPGGSPPSPNETVEIVGVCRSSSIRNIELNFLRLSLINGQAANACSAGACGTGSCGSPLSITGMLGVRYFNFDEDFEIGYDYGADGTFNSSAGEIFNRIDVENQMLGFQFGFNANYAIGCRWNLFCDTNVGIYNNHVNAWERFTTGDGLGVARFNSNAGNADVRASEDSIAFLTEMRLGGSYQINNCWRLTAAYRVLAVTGVSTTQGELEGSEGWLNRETVAHIHSDRALIMHGLQAGVEYKF